MIKNAVVQFTNGMSDPQNLFALHKKAAHWAAKKSYYTK